VRIELSDKERTALAGLLGSRIAALEEFRRGFAEDTQTFKDVTVRLQEMQVLYSKLMK
jgi:phage/plasmid-associated DNA primase